MAKNIYQIYLLLVSFFSIVILTVCSSLLLNDIMNYNIPQYAKYSILQKYESDAAYVRYLEGLEPKVPVPANVSEQRLQEKDLKILEIKGEAIQSMTGILAWIVITFLLFISHLKLFLRQRAT